MDGLFRMGTDYQYIGVSVNLNYQVNKITDFLDVPHSFQILVKELILKKVAKAGERGGM